MARKVGWQDQEETGHNMPTVRKESEECLCSAHLLLFSQSGSPAHRMAPLTFAEVERGSLSIFSVTKSRKSPTLLSFSTSSGNHTLLPVCGYPWEMSRGFDTSNFLGSPSTQASPLQLHVMTSEGLLPAQRLYEETPRPHISQPLHLSEIMKEESTSSSPSLRSRLQSQ